MSDNFMHTDSVTGAYNTDEHGYQLVQGAQHGWICPQCGRVYAPFMPYCMYCNQYRSVTVTGTSTGDVKEPQEYITYCGKNYKI